MQEKMDNDIKNFQAHSNPTQQTQPPVEKEGDYIDFEEVKK